MASYKVISDKIAGKKIGDTITDEELAGMNIDALLGVHLEQPKNTKKESES
jgi:hypothetical protein